MKPDPSSVRRLLVERARARRAARRSDGFRRLTRDDAAPARGVIDILTLDEALTRLSALDAEQARIVELRYFGALTIQQTADAIGTSADVVTRQWTMARAWLKRAIDSASDDGGALEL
jgi:DNA-directed RNA polymerase specialized sigma24 family protein